MSKFFSSSSSLLLLFPLPLLSASSSSSGLESDDDDYACHFFVMNLTTKKVHKDSADGPACGKPYPFKAEYLLELPANGRLCAMCFR